MTTAETLVILQDEEILKLQAEIERLRAALEIINASPPPTNLLPCEQLLQTVWKIAHDALADTPVDKSLGG